MTIQELVEHLNHLQALLIKYGRNGNTVAEIRTMTALSEARRSLIKQLFNERDAA